MSPSLMYISDLAFTEVSELIVAAKVVGTARVKTRPVNNIFIVKGINKYSSFTLLYAEVG